MAIGSRPLVPATGKHHAGWRGGDRWDRRRSARLVNTRHRVLDLTNSIDTSQSQQVFRCGCSRWPGAGPRGAAGWMVSMPAYDAFLLLSFGGPEGPDDVLPFLENVTRGRGA